MAENFADTMSKTCLDAINEEGLQSMYACLDIKTVDGKAEHHAAELNRLLDKLREVQPLPPSHDIRPKISAPDSSTICIGVRLPTKMSQSQAIPDDIQ